MSRDELQFSRHAFEKMFERGIAPDLIFGLTTSKGGDNNELRHLQNGPDIRR